MFKYVTRLIHTIWVNLTDILFPIRCVGCSKKDILLCVDCIKKAKNSKDESLLRRPLNRVLSYGLYENEYLRKAIMKFKYNGAYGLSNPFAHMLYEIVKPHLSSIGPDALIVPIPISRDRMRSRGYNQAKLLAESLALKIGCKSSDNLLVKSRSTTSQTSLSHEERLKNVINSFSVNSPELAHGKKIILVDDVMTTGATLSEAAHALKNAGAKEITGLVVART